MAVICFCFYYHCSNSPCGLLSRTIKRLVFKGGNRVGFEFSSLPVNFDCVPTLFDLCKNWPFSLWLQRGFVKNVPTEILEASRIDGASGLKVLRYVVFPLILPGSIVVFIYAFINTWNNFLVATVFLQGGEKQTLTTQLARFIGTEGLGLFGPFAAATVLSVIPTLLLFIVLQRKFTANLVAGAVKS